MVNLETAIPLSQIGITAYTIFLFIISALLAKSIRLKIFKLSIVVTLSTTIFILSSLYITSQIPIFRFLLLVSIGFGLIPIFIIFLTVWSFTRYNLYNLQIGTYSSWIITNILTSSVFLVFGIPDYNSTITFIISASMLSFIIGGVGSFIGYALLRGLDNYGLINDYEKMKMEELKNL